MRENGRADDVVMAVYSICAPHGRDSTAILTGVDRSLIHRVRQFDPIGRRGVLVIRRERATAIEIRAKAIFAHVFDRDIADLRLDHLGNFLLQRHAGENLL